ncbi:hypothetical protein QFC20_004756 [Naganishia adeliensis]|uniref:Uncharacterized protein n=1 Tax=Naganishia adeliensis TaxID=92952 RepID=A0ACC2VVX5_9TREE|nr:hypothetical protein QFC20_004756 [Naganishia adeliensis]
MPELPEVERARKLIEETCKGYKIAHVDTHEDKIVYTGGITHEDYAKALVGRTITGCSRKGKMLWMDLSGEGPLPVMHFGMNGMLMLKGREPDWYMRKPKRRQEDKRVWPPPKYVKFLLKLEPQESSVSSEPQELAFLDSRRLGKLRLVPQPALDHPPISDLGFDPYLSPPTLEEFTTLLRARPRSTIKGLIMDQSFSAGVGNWVADEILHLARVHPAAPAGMLADAQVETVWKSMKDVVNIAVEANADHSKFPKHWLFSWRWSKGKKDKNRKTKDDAGGMLLVGSFQASIHQWFSRLVEQPDGSPATLKFITVGGRTSAYIEELQVLPEGVVYKEPVKRGKVKKGDDAGLSSEDLSDAPLEETVVKESSDKPVKRKRVTKKKSATAVKQEEGVDSGLSSDLSEADELGTDAEVKPSEAVLSNAGNTKPTVSAIGSKRKRAIPKHEGDTDAKSEEKPAVPDKKKRKVPARRGRGDRDAKDAASSPKRRKRVTEREQDSSDLSSLSGQD